VPRVVAKRELLAPRKDVWAFLAEPRHLADWWPGVADVRPDRRGLAEGARWEILGNHRPTMFRQAAASGILQVLAVQPYERLAFNLTGDRIGVDLHLRSTSEDRTEVLLAVDGTFMFGMSRSLPRRALGRLHSLCQTAAEQ
jgi:uncharacterized protein YndB with AHSA1/START domain